MEQKSMECPSNNSVAEIRDSKELLIYQHDRLHLSITMCISVNIIGYSYCIVMDFKHSHKPQMHY